MRPRPGRRAILRAVVAVVLVAGAACKHKSQAIAELTSADGPVDRQDGEAAGWIDAPVGTEYFIGDSARTKDGGAKLTLAGTANVAMQPHTILKFGGSGSNGRIAVEEGIIDITGSGNYQLDIGELNLANNGTVRITAKGKGESSLELTIGSAKVVKTGEAPMDLAIGKPVDVFSLDLGAPKAPVDAGVIADAALPALDAAVDSPAQSSDVATIVVTGPRAETQLAGDRTWKKLPAGSGPIAKGTKLRLGAATKATVTARSTTVELGANSRASVGDDLVVTVDAGAATATVQANEAGAVILPGGSFEIAATPSPSDTRVDVGATQSKVVVARGGGKLVGSTGGSLDMNRGESATLTRGGTIHVVEGIPQQFDFRLPIGETAVIHDPKPPTAVQFQFLGKCAQGGIVELDRDARFRTTRVSSGKDNANLLIGPGSWAYRLRCTVGANEGAPVAQGRITVVKDDGRRPLPAVAATNEVYTDGRTTTLSYQSAIPNLVVRYDGTGSQFVLHLASGGKDDTFPSSSPRITVPGTRLHEGTYTYWVDHDGTRGDSQKISTLKIDFDNTAPQVYIESPANGQAFTDNTEVRVSALAGWTAQLDGTPLPNDNRRRFVAKVGPPSAGNALAIRLSHARIGTHYYLRRAK